MLTAFAAFTTLLYLASSLRREVPDGHRAVQLAIGVWGVVAVAVEVT
jgi:hypothetical protein